MKAKAILAAIMAMPLFAVADAVRVYDVDEYVTDGLVGHFDAIRNDGADAAHSSTATTWKNLAGGPDAEFQYRSGSTPDSGWTDMSYSFQEDAMATTVDTLDLGTNFTVQIAITATPSAQTRSTIGGERDPSKYNSWFNDNPKNDYGFWTSEASTTLVGNFQQLSQTTSKIRPSISNWGGKYVTWMLDGANSLCWTFETNTIPTGTSITVVSTKPDARKYSWGAEQSSSLQAFLTGEYHSVRMYDRVLTEDEIKQNRIVDEARFRNEASKGKGNDDVNVIVASNVDGLEGAEECGKWYIPEGTHTFTAPASVFVGKKGYALAGYTVEEWNDSAWGDAVTNSGASYTASSSSEKVRLTWLWTPILRTADVDDYVQDGLILHFDGIRNAGATEAHSTDATTWVNLGSLGSAQDATLKTLGSSVPSGAKDGKWGDTSYWFGGKNYFDIGGTVALGGAVTAQFVVDFTGGTSQVASYPIFLGSTSTDKDNFGVYCPKNDSRINFKICASKAHISDSEYSGGNGFINAIYDSANKQVSIGEAAKAAWQSSKASGEMNAVSYAIGTAHKSDGNKAARILVGNVHAVRVYKRVLSDEELAANREIDEIRFRGNVTVVNGEIGETGENGECSLSGGVYNLDSGTWTVTASDYIRDGRRYRPRLTVETLTNGEWVRTNRIWTDSYTIDKSALGDDRIRLTWTWEIRNGLIIMFR